MTSHSYRTKVNMDLDNHQYGQVRVRRFLV